MDDLVEHLARVEAGHHYGHRFGKPVDDPHVVMNVDSNWQIFVAPIERALNELLRLGVILPELKRT
jgi:hypothetical protein